MRTPFRVPAVDIATIPRELLPYRQWVVWKWGLRDGKSTKLPHEPATGLLASVTNPDSWDDFESALAAVNNGAGFDGIGFVLTPSDPFVGVDLDKCRDAETSVIEPWANKIVDDLKSYTEVTPSGTGLRIFVQGTLPPGGRRKNQVEIYDSARYLTVTGRHLSDTSRTIEQRSAELATLHRHVFGDTASPVTRTVEPVALEDQQIVERARCAANGDKFTQLWEGRLAPDADHSAADLALCNQLSFWTGRDHARIDRMFRRSGLMRRKWDERHGARTFGEMTIDKAIASCVEVYTAKSNVMMPAPSSEAVPTDRGEWAPPADLPGPHPVPEFPAQLLPEPLRDWVLDIADRSQCPPEFVAVGAVVGLAAVVGRQIGVRPKRQDDWLVVPNLWGLVIGRPGILKTPALAEALRPLQRLAMAAQEAHAEAITGRAFDEVEQRARRAHLDGLVKKAVKAGKPTDELRKTFDGLNAAPPVEKRYIVNDSTVEKLGELLNENPNGLLLFRDEITGFLDTMERQGHENDRAFYLEAWNGTSKYSYDRIGRGTLHISAACMSMLGGIQPGPLNYYLRDAFCGGKDDGLIQRFQLMVYPDAVGEWRNVDRWPDTAAKARAFEVFTQLDAIDAVSLHADAAPDEIPWLRFDPAAQQLFDGWRGELEAKIRSADEHPVIVSHLAKYRSLMPSLALLFHLVEYTATGAGGPIGEGGAIQAAAWCDFLEAHARRVYQGVTERSVLTARLLVGKIRASALTSPFRGREVYRRGWAGLTDKDEVAEALELLVDLGWLREIPSGWNEAGGRPTVSYLINPNVTGGAGR